MSGQHERRKKFGIFLVTVKETLNGYDTVAGMVKIPLWLTGITVTAVYAPYILGIAIPLGVIYGIRGIVDEKANHLKIKESENKYAKLADKAYDIETQLDRYFAEEFLQNQELYSEIYAQGICRANKKILLRYLLRDYLDYIQSIKRKKNGRFVYQGKIFDLIKSVTGYDSKDPKFLANMKTFFDETNDYGLSGNPKKTQTTNTKLFYKQFCDFYFSAPKAIYAPEIEEKKGFINTIKKYYQKTKVELNKVRTDFNRQKKTRTVIRRIVDFISDCSLGMGIPVAIMTLFGIIVAGSPVTLPLVGVIILSGIIVGGISLAYNMYVDKQRRRVIKKLDDKIADREINIALSKRILQIKKHKALNEFAELSLHDYADLSDENDKTKYIPRPAYTLPWSYRLVRASNYVTQNIAAIALGLAVGMSIVWLATLLVPALPFLIPAVIVGVAFAAFYVGRTTKIQFKANQAKDAELNELADSRHDLEYKEGVGKQRIQSILMDKNSKPKDNRVLLQEVIHDYVDYIDALFVSDQPHYKFKPNQVFRKQEKILALIEKVSGVTRGDDLDLFFNSVARYIKGDNKDSSAANATVQRLKDLVCIDSKFTAVVNADDLRIIPKSSKLKSVGIFCKDHILPGLGMVGLALGVPIMLIGPHAFVAIGILAAVVLTAYTIYKVTEYASARQAKKLEDNKNQVALLERKIKLENKKNEINLDHTKDASFQKTPSGRKASTVNKDSKLELHEKFAFPEEDLPSDSKAKAPRASGFFNPKSQYPSCVATKNTRRTMSLNLASLAQK